jgi:hypothetical protein
MNKSTIATISLCLWMNLIPAFSESLDSTDVKNTETNGSTAIQAVEKETESLKSSNKVSVQREFPFVESSQFELDLQAVIEPEQSLKTDIDRKIRAEFTPIRLSIINKTGKLLKVPRESVYYLNNKGESVHLPTEEAIFKNVKRNGVTRALAWGVPLGLVSFGILAIPSFMLSGAHTKSTNGTVKGNLDKTFYQGGHIPPEGGVSTFVFIPKKNFDATKLVIGRVINVEDQTETEKTIDIQKVEPTNAKKK